MESWTNILTSMHSAKANLGLERVDFSKSKFLSLPLKQQHKICAELIRCVYEKFASSMHTNDLDLYFQLSAWMTISHLPIVALKSLSDRFHFHVKHAELSIREPRLLPKVSTVDRETGSNFWPISIYLDNLRSAHNVGSILRTTEAFSLGSVHFSEATPFIDQKQVQDAAMGAEKWINCHRSASLKNLPRPYILLETSPQALSLNGFSFPETFTLVVGNEEYGCSDHSLSEADFLIEIPLRGRKNSLNVANAFSIAAAQIAFQIDITKRTVQ